MLSHKRKNTTASDSEESSFGDDNDEPEVHLDFPRKKSKAANQEDDDDEDLNRMLHDSIARRNVKSGTEVLKKAKGKTKLTKGEVGGGSFQSMGLHPSLLRSLNLQGYRIPTPIQRLAIPALLADPPRDLVGMARTGSGKSLAYLVPLVQRLGGKHTTIFGARALILLPTRELALQILKVGKELARGWQSGSGDHAGDSKQPESSQKGQSLRWGLIVGGEGMDEQFEMITANPDVIIATPGRLLHLIVEMKLDLKSVQYVVFDEADRLFEMGFETALNEILNRLPSSRQTLLFSATLPKSLVEFAKAGLQDPKLVRLDAESKISSDLKMAFFSLKQVEKEACLLNLLRDVIQVPLGTIEDSQKADAEKPKEKGKGKAKRPDQITAPHQTLIFVATKHHVEYLTTLLTTAGYSVSHIYGTLDQQARTFQMDQFRRGVTNILVVTDVAARGIDIPVLENVVNYDFPQGARVFVHRVGRTARAGRQGWAWSFVTNSELPYLLDLQLFLSRPLKCEMSGEGGDSAFVESLMLGTFEREKIDAAVEYVRSLSEINHSLPMLKEVMKRGHAMYERSKGKASPPSYKRAKEMIKDPKWMLAGTSSGIHPVLLRGNEAEVDDGAKKRQDQEAARQALLRTVNSFRPAETVLEVASKGNTANAALMKERRKALSRSIQRSQAAISLVPDEEEDEAEDEVLARHTMEMANEEEIVAVFDTSIQKHGYKDSEYYMSHYQKDAETEKGYALTDGASFVEQAQNATFDLTGDEGNDRKRRQLSWDKKKKKFVQGGGIGADNVKLVRTESGAKLPATYRSGRFDEWKKQNRTSLPRVGEIENPTNRASFSGRKFKHNKVTEAKPLDKLNKDYDRKVRQINKQDDAAPDAKGGKNGGRYRGKPIGKVRSELKNAEQIRKSRKILDQKRAKNGRHAKGGKGKGKGRH